MFQAIIDSPDEKIWAAEELPKIFAPFTAQNVVDVVKGLRPIALKLRDHRFENGALRIDQPKLSFRIDHETGLPSEFNIYKNMECHRYGIKLRVLD
jgi:DIS3-like exonuclease 2